MSVTAVRKWGQMGSVDPAAPKKKSPRKSNAAYVPWVQMRARCRNPNDPFYAMYGGRGITVCERWKRFENFLADMGERPPGTSIDRIDNDGHYEPGNCRWATRMEQSRNTRYTRLIEFNGEVLCMTDWAKRFGVSVTCMAWRIRTYGPTGAVLMGPKSNKHAHAARRLTMKLPGGPV